MAKKCELKNIKSDRSTSISVDILQDGEGFILVSYNNGPKNFQGVLVEVNRSGVPCGVKPPAWYNVARPGSSARSPDPDDPYHTVSTRMTYFQTHHELGGTKKPDAEAAPAPPPPPAKRRHHHKGGRSMVRLRPRQVLCSNCKSMCTESSQSVQPAARRRRDGDENVDPAAAAAGAAAVPAPPPPPDPVLRSPTQPPPPPPPVSAAPLPPPPPLKLPRIPIVRLSAQQLRRSSSCAGDDDTTADNGGSGGGTSSSTMSLSSSASSSPTPPSTPTLAKLTVSPIKIVGNNVKKCGTPAPKPKLQKIKISGGAIVPPPNTVPAAAAGVIAEAGDADVARRTGLRKKRLAVGSMEDLWDESVLDDGHRTASSEQEDAASLTPVLKISFGGREGAGTVLKIPAKYKLQAGEPEPERPAASATAAGAGAALHPAAPTASAKAAKRALKKARKDVQRKLVGSPRASPAYHPWGARSPAYPRLSPSYPQMSPAYYRVASAVLGLSPAHPGLSPAHPGSGPGPAAAPAAAPVPAPASSSGPLRKKRHKHKLKHKRRRRERNDRESTAGAASAEVQMKERCLSQKLSISLRRIRESEYAADAPDNTSTSTPGPSSSSSSSSVTLAAAAPAPETAAADDVEMPPFSSSPPPPPPAPAEDASVSSCQLPDGRKLRLNDVIWGKVHGFPWWPGKVMCINDGGAAYQEAYVSWYGSTTSSLMPCSQLLPFLDTFESRVNRKRRGPYREAVRQATLEAERALPAAAAPAATSQPPSQSPLALAGSPPEVDVAS